MLRWLLRIACALLLAAALWETVAAVENTPPSAASGASASASSASASSASAQQGDTDIQGPLGPLKLPGYLSKAFRAHRWFRRLVAAAIAIGFAGIGFHYLLRKRRKAALIERASAMPPVRALADEAEHLSDAEFYARLLRVLREALTPETPRPAAVMTPRELADLELYAVIEAEQAAGGLHDRWRALCLRAERAEYGRARIRGHQRREDLQLVMDLIEKADQRRAAREQRREL